MELLQQPTGVTGCGRTDAGVHASFYTAHFDTERELSPRFLTGLNSLLPPDIAVYEVKPVAPDFHARYNAIQRSYQYIITGRKEPLAQETTWFFPQYPKIDRSRLELVGELLTHYGEFFPFCKTHSGTNHYRCAIFSAGWTIAQTGPNRLEFNISANRFLRGMVRLIVGTSIKVSLGQLEIDQVKNALDLQAPLPKNFMAPPQGLFLTNVRYPDGSY